MQTLPDLPDDAIVSAKRLSEMGFGHTVTLANKRKSRKGPPFIKLSEHRIAYRMGDVRAWLAERTVKAR